MPNRNDSIIELLVVGDHDLSRIASELSSRWGERLSLRPVIATTLDDPAPPGSPALILAHHASEVSQRLADLQQLRGVGESFVVVAKGALEELAAWSRGGVTGWTQGLDGEILTGWAQAATARFDLRCKAKSQVAESRQSTKYLRQIELLEQMTDSGLWEWSQRDKTIWLSPNAAAIFGLESTEWNQSAEELIEYVIVPEDRVKILRSIEAIRQNGTPRIDECRTVSADGTSRTIWSWARGEFDEHGTLVRAFGAVHDVTAVARVRAELRRRELELAESARVSVLGLLSSQITHELNQPLYSISNYAEACRLKLSEELDDRNREDVLEWLERIGTQARATGESIRRMTRLLQRRTGISEVHDLVEIVRETAPLFGETLVGQEIALIEAYPEDCCPIRCDRVMIRQVVAILLTNAVEAIAQQAPVKPRIELTIRRTDAGFELAVRDNGCGLPHDRFLSFCRPFVSEKPEAMGIGLAIAKAIIESLHGRLWAEPSGGCGADIRMLLPVAETGTTNSAIAPSSIRHS